MISYGCCEQIRFLYFLCESSWGKTCCINGRKLASRRFGRQGAYFGLVETLLFDDSLRYGLTVQPAGVLIFMAVRASDGDIQLERGGVFALIWDWKHFHCKL
jgi:hypothetical protein